jgi:hypothetical protein
MAAVASQSGGAMRGGLSEEKDRDKDSTGDGDVGGDKNKDRDREQVRDRDRERDKDSAISNLAMLRAQRAMADRLSSTGRTNLPTGVMLHDDPISKTNAFLSLMPALT